MERTIRSLLLAALVVTLSSPLLLGATSVVISELQPQNRATLRDEDGDLSDWIELLGVDGVPVDLEGWSLTDDPSVPKKWVLPRVVLAPGQFLLIFASGKNRSRASRELHTNFRLDEKGEFVGVFEPTGVLVSHLVYPTIPAGFSYGVSQNGTFETLVPAGAPVKTHVPLDDTLGSIWTDPTFDDSSWSGSTTGVGYDHNQDYHALFGTDIGNAMDGVNTTAFVRIPFHVDDPTQFSTFSLRMRYDDGFIAHLNGRRVASRNAPSSPTWNSASAGDRPDNLAMVAEEIVLDEVLAGDLDELLRPGTNVLALQGLNRALDSSDFLIAPELDAVGVGALDPESTLFFPQPSPQRPNSPGFIDVAPEPEFSQLSQVFSGSMTVTLSAPRGSIRFSTDGTEPGEQSQLYTGPFALGSSTMIRAKAFVDGLAPSPTVSEAYVMLSADVLGFTSELPVVVIENFGRGEVPGDPHTPAYLVIFEPVDGSTRLNAAPVLQTRIGIKTRGSSSLGRPKKSYTLEAWDEFDEDVDIEPLGLSRESDWILYGAFNFDLAHLRNAFMYELSNRLGRYAIRTRFCEVFLNTGGGSVSYSDGDYRGIYSFFEKIKRGPERVDVEKLGAGDASLPNVAGGYIVKIDRLDPGDGGFGAGGLGMGFVYPKESLITGLQRSYISGYINDMVDAINGPQFRDPVRGYRRYVDVDSWIDHHILNVLAKNVDALRLSTYMFKRRDGKYEFGPIWDFDRSMESQDGRDDSPTGWDSGDGGTRFFTFPWWGRLFEDVDFWQAWIDRWQTLRRQQALETSSMHATIDRMAAEIRSAQPRDLDRWGQTPRFGGFQGEISHLKDWLAERARWIDRRFVAPPVFDSPSRLIEPGFRLTMSAAAGGTIYFTEDGRDPRLAGGGVAPWAVRYTGPRILAGESRVSARVLDANGGENVWSGPTVETFSLEDSTIGGRQLQGDTNQDGRLGLGDATRLLRILFVEREPSLPCGGSGPNDEGNLLVLDVSGNGVADIGDAVGLLNFLFRGGRAPVAGAECIEVVTCPDACF